jgi:uncharacterized C2H2 Zn-finger protein
MDENKEYTVKQFRKNHPQLIGKGKRLLLCDHLKNKTMSFIEINLWIGDNSRILLCPICAKLFKQTIWEHMAKETLFMMESFKKIEYQNWVEEAGK